jgi:hypothetical protein
MKRNIMKKAEYLLKKTTTYFYETSVLAGREHDQCAGF